MTNSYEQLEKLFSPKQLEECIEENKALYSKGYYDSNPDTNPEYKRFIEKMRDKYA